MDSPLPPLPVEDIVGLPASFSLPQTLSWAIGPRADVAGLCTLRDGVAVTVRPIHDDDVQRLRAFHLNLSPETIFLRFAHLLCGFPDELAVRLACVDGDQRMAFVATDAADTADTADDPTHEQIIAVARYDYVRPQIAEMATVVADLWQGRGLGPLLLYRLALYGRSRGYATFIAPMSRWNSRAIRALLHSGFPYTLKQLDEDTLLASVDITPLDCYVVLSGE